MVQPGGSMVPWRGPVWGGQSTESIADRGERTLRRVVNGYIAGREIRMFPGFRCVLDPWDGPGIASVGYERLVNEGKRPVAKVDPLASKLRVRDTATEMMRGYARPRHIHCFDVIRGRPVLVGESGLRIEPLLDVDTIAAPTVMPVMTGWTKNGSNQAEILLDVAVDGADRFNSIEIGDCLWLGSITDDNAADAARLAQRIHYVVGYSVGQKKITLSTTVANVSTSTTLSIEVGRACGPLGGVQSLLTNGRGIYGEDALNAPDDADSLTAYWLDGPLSITGNVLREVHPSYVANRRRDFSDDAQGVAMAGIRRRTEGHSVSVWVEDGIATLATTTTLQVAGAGWTVNQWNNYVVRFMGPGAAQQTRAILSNTADTLTWTTAVTGINAQEAFQILDASLQYWGSSRRRKKSLPYRVVPDVAGPDLLLAAPGYGCGFRVPGLLAGRNDADDDWNGLLDMPRSNGVPKAILAVPNGTDGGALVTTVSGSGGYAVGTYRIAVAYRDEATGELGQISEEWVFTKDPGGGDTISINVMVMHPGYVLAECLALSVMVFMSRANEDPLQHIATFQLRDSIAAPSSTSSEFGLTQTTDNLGTVFSFVDEFYLFTLPAPPSDLDLLYNPDVEYPLYRTMPRGCRSNRTIRGTTVYGGSMGNTGLRKELQEGHASLIYGGAAARNNSADELTIRNHDLYFNRQDTGWFVGNETIPSAYGGVAIYSETLFPFPMCVATIDKVRNCHTDNPVNGATPADVREERHYRRYGLIENPHRWDGYPTFAYDSLTHLILPRGQVQLSEPGLPGVTLSFGIQIIDVKKEDDVVAVGEYRGIGLLCGMRETYSIQWNRGAAGAAPFLVTSSVGCIAPNTMHENDDMAPWIADSGVVAYTPFGVVERVGRALERWFRGDEARFLKDSQGMMLHAFARYDEDRGISLFGVFENREDGTADEVKVAHQSLTPLTWDQEGDEAKSRWPCDTILVWNPRYQAFTEWHPPVGVEPVWVGKMPFDDGVARMCFMGRDLRLYAFEDHYGIHNRECPITTVTAAGTATTTLSCTDTALASTYAARGGQGKYVARGTDVVVYDAATKTIYHRALVASAAAGVLTLQTAGTWPATASVIIGVRSMTIEMPYTNMKGSDATNIGAFCARVRLASRIQDQDNTDAVAQPVWWQVAATRQTHQSGRHGAARDILFTRNPNGDYVGSSAAEEAVLTVRAAAGSLDAQESTFTVEFFGGAQVCLQDLMAEAG